FARTGIAAPAFGVRRALQNGIRISPRRGRNDHEPGLALDPDTAQQVAGSDADRLAIDSPKGLNRDSPKRRGFIVHGRIDTTDRQGFRMQRVNWNQACRRRQRRMQASGSYHGIAPKPDAPDYQARLGGQSWLIVRLYRFRRIGLGRLNHADRKL